MRPKGWTIVSVVCGLLISPQRFQQPRLALLAVFTGSFGFTQDNEVVLLLLWPDCLNGFAGAPSTTLGRTNVNMPKHLGNALGLYEKNPGFDDIVTLTTYLQFIS